MAKEYIDREAAINTIFGLYTKVDDDGYVWVLRGDAVKAIDNIPAADVRENVRGEWYWTGHPNLCQCLICREWIGKDAARHMNFCPNCGAQMGGAEDG